MMAALIDHDRIAEVYDGTVGSREFQRVSRQRIHWMCSQVTGPDVLDIGCSQGVASILLAREGHRVVGVDREHEAIRAARERLDEEEAHVRERVEFRVGEGRAVGFPDHSFDAVLLGEVLEHRTALADVSRRADELEAEVERLRGIVDTLEQELAGIRGRLGYRIGRFLRRPFRRGKGPAR
jgi:2-polyprenyl-3-methyl-5-hydroxy-6-metoxy-1,4-benzoquinol methylase